MARRILATNRAESGFTIVEVVLALAIIAIALIATAPMFVLAAKENASGGDLGLVGSLAVERMEELRSQYIYLLPNGGGVDANVADYSDTSDPDFDVRWLITDKPGGPVGMKLIVVRAVATRQVIGKPKSVTMVTVRGE